MSKRRTYTKEFKEAAVRMYLDSDKTMQEVAESLGVSKYHIKDWKKSYESKDNPFPGSGNREDKDSELYKLKKEMADLKMENEILKKAMAIFSREK